MLTLTDHDKKLISDIVQNFPEGDRVKVLRAIFKNEVTYTHFIFLGTQIEAEKIRNNFHQIDSVFRLKTLSYLN